MILAGVYDIKNLKLKLRPESEHQYNSPWNTRESNEENERLCSFDDCSRDQIEHVRFDIAAEFDIEMSFSVTQIAMMLEEYENDHHTGMDRQAVAEEIYAYTSGYPVLVSSICKYIDEELGDETIADKSAKVWSKAGVEKAVEKILKEKIPLFESMVKQLDIYEDLHKMIEDIIYCGKRVPFSPEERSINLGIMFGYLKEVNGQVAMANRIFEMCLLNLFMAREAINSDVFERGEIDRIHFIKGSRLDMNLILKKFVAYFHEIYGDNDEKFVETYGRKFIIKIRGICSASISTKIRKLA